MVAALDNERAGTAAALAEPRDRRGRRRRVRPPRLPRRPGARRRVHLAAPERPGLELRRQQLPARQGAAGVRRPLLEPGHRPPRGRPAPRLHPPRPGQLARASPARSRCSARPVDLGAVDVDSYIVAGLDRPHHPVGERLPQHAAARRRRRASSSRPAATSRRSSTRPRPDSRARATASPTTNPADARGVGRAAPRRCPAAGGPTTTRGSPRARASSSPRPSASAAPATRRRPRRPAATSTPAERRRPCPPALPYAHLGDALATDYFHVREQFTDEQWEHFLATRRFVDEEVLPAINEYWEAAELPVAADAPARRARPATARTSRATAARA